MWNLAALDDDVVRGAGPGIEEDDEIKEEEDNQDGAKTLVANAEKETLTRTVGLVLNGQDCVKSDQLGPRE
ncbi:hypothetical protein KFK09_016067 [Dendrobium nobile]|uniref:Uncharacterized protein n=1 Tax=Dendrobium nobile TaxID=94219 RepID=A0A8T3AYK6_DENNO|nr:hypothetical protein KFK09_016067 [Dendrobium nobile]